MIALLLLQLALPPIPPPPLPPLPVLGWYFHAPCRWLDTRIPGCIPGSVFPIYPCPQGPLTHREWRQYLVQAGAVCMDTGERPIPVGVQHLIVRLTAVDATAKGQLFLYNPTVLWRPGVLSLRFKAGETVGQQFMVPLGQLQGQQPGIPILPDLAVLAYVREGSVHVVVDLIGYTMYHEG